MTGAVLLNCFNMWDSDGDGFIKQHELTSVLMTLGVDPDDCARIWSQADSDRNGFLDFTRFSKWVWSDDAPHEIKAEITQWIMEGSGKTKSDLTDWIFSPWIIAKDKDVYHQLTLKKNWQFELKLIRLSIPSPCGEGASLPPPMCTLVGSGKWELDSGDCILTFQDGRVDGYTLTKLKQLQEENQPARL